MAGDDIDDEASDVDADAGDEDDLELVVGEVPDVPDVEIPDVVDVLLVDDAIAPADEEEEEEPDVVVGPVLPPPVRPQPGRPPSAREEPPPPFAVGERVILIQNTRPRTGTLIGNYPVGATGRVETVLSQTAIVRFDVAPDTKEVVAFTCLESAEKPGARGVRRVSRRGGRARGAPSPEAAGSAPIGSGSASPLRSWVPRYPEGRSAATSAAMASAISWSERPETLSGRP